MADPKGDKLFVNIGASQARRRLKGFGHGVRKVQTAGRNRAVVIHTATGQHLRELEAQFADVGFSAIEEPPWQPIESPLGFDPTSTVPPLGGGESTSERLGTSKSSPPSNSPNDDDRTGR